MNPLDPTGIGPMRHSSRRRFSRVRRLAPALVLSLAPLFGAGQTGVVHAASGDCTASGAQVSCTFTYTGAAQTWTVPAGVTQATFDVLGAQGGGPGGGAGGPGGEAKATLAVTAGTTYQVTVGGTGYPHDGFNGGGAPGCGLSFRECIGGGASDVRIGGFSLGERVIVAGGGGGAGIYGDGGAGGGLLGVGGQAGPSCDLDIDISCSSGGSGGTQAGGGIGGAGGIGLGGAGVGRGGDGALGVGGGGGSGSNGCSGGGGGGGYYGGGGGGGAGCPPDSSGGGGGSGYVRPSATNTTLTSGVHAGDGVVTITYTTSDTTPPTATPTRSGTLGTNGWYTGDVTVSWNWADNTGGRGIDTANCTTSSTSSGEGAQLILSATCKDLAGNTGSASETVKVDKTAPTVSAAATTQPNANGWYTGNVTVHFTCTDGLSGIPAGTCPADQVLSTDGSAVSSTAQTVKDAAGNTSAPSNVVTVKLDKTPPTATPIQSPKANATGWNNSDVTVSWNWADSTGGSGLDSANCTSTTTSSGEGTLSLTATCRDLAGNPATATVSVKVDKTAPVTTATPAPGTLDPGLPLITVTGTATVKDTTGSTVGTDTFTCFNSKGLKLALAAKDSGSGVASLTYAATGEQTIASTTVAASTAQPAITAPGVTTLTYAATDAAGNLEATHSENVIVGRGFACANPTPTFSMPKHGTLQLSGTATIGGRSFPFNDTISF